ncbi:FAD-dependent oxidoreductase [Lacticaseibacillus kribbianus]|uniref:FAD-dependent oxidoreductase n=1 Tax=Lacticaseibacillus kribbianus TaxID=2926292 RepID=UPI001CD653D9|nr:FAD-dependent oxidoreductase [Lacticaseibacillus kribbianus]
MGKHYVIIGGVAGGASTATRLRRLDESAEITIYEAGPYVSFANCGLPYYVGGVIADREALLVSSVAALKQDFNLDVHVNHRVTAIDPAAQTVTVQAPTGVLTTHYDELIFSTGARPLVPSFPGLDDADNCFTVRTVPDVDAITAYLASHPAKHATVVGGGFIGLEMVENLAHRGLAVTLVEAAPQVLPPLDWEMVQAVHEHLRDNGVDLRLNTKVTGFGANGHEVNVAGGEVIATDLVVLAIGIRPNSELAQAAGVATDARGFITVSPQFETSVPHIFAVGDVISVTDAVTGEKRSVALAGPANRQGRYLADSLCGIARTNPAVLGSSVAKVFALTAASTGANERQLQAAGQAYQVIHLHPSSSAGYYPGAAPLSLKVLYAPDGRILGAQAVGTTKVAQRIDVIATAARLGAKVADLADVEVCYAPPYASAKDPVNFAGYIADDLQRGLVKTIQWSQVDALLAAGAHFLDVREDDELLAEPALPGAIHIPRSQLRQRLAELPQDAPLYVYCAVGLRGYNVCRLLSQNGFETFNLDGGLKTYRTAKASPLAPPLTAAPVAVEAQQAGDRPATAAATAAQSAGSRPTAQQAGAQPTTAQPAQALTLDACGLQCPGPIVKVRAKMATMQDGDRLTVTASDFGFHKDIAAWALATGNTVVTNAIQGDKVVATLQKGTAAAAPTTAPDAAASPAVTHTAEGTTIVVFDGDFDKAIASLIIAQGAATMGQPVTMFFTFWGLSVIKKPGVKLRKTGLAKAFDIALPASATKLPLSKMNFLGAGRKMIKHLMRTNNVDQLEVMLAKAQAAGVKMVACTMSMGLMGVEAGELIDGVELGGVATYLGDARNRSTNLFI